MSALASMAASKEQGSSAIAWRFDPELKVRLLVMQPTPFCNISCDYCYLAGRNDRRQMPGEVVQATAERLLESGLLAQRLGIVWHAGEPLVAPVSFYDSAFEILAKALGAATHLEHSVQTNGTLIDERWCDLFKRWGVRVGVSLDGPADLHDKHRKTRNGKPTHSMVMRGVEALQQAGIPFHVIAVLTAESLARADEIFDFFVRHGIRQVGFNIDEQEGVHRISSVGEHDSGHGKFLRRLLERSVQDAGQLDIRELEVAARLITHELPRINIDGNALPDNAQILPFAILSVAANGDFSTFSPELIDQEHPRHGSFVFGNVRRDPLRTMLNNERFQGMFAEMLDGVARCRESCEFFSLCGGGAPANKLAEHGTLASAETSYCRAVVKRPLEIVLDHLERVA